MDMALFATAFGAIFAILNPFSTLPLFLSMTDDLDPASQRWLGVRVSLICSALIIVVFFTGTEVLKFFGISTDEFRVAGGIVLMTISLGMLNGTGSTAHSGTPAERAAQAQLSSIAFYPISFPMVVGPGTITTIIVFTARAHDMPGKIAVAAALAIVMAMTALVLWFAGSIGHLMSQTLRTIVTRLMGMILAAMAVGMIATGLKALLPGLAG